MADKKSHVQWRDNKDGQFVKKREADRLPPSRTTREHVPNPGHGDVDRGPGKRK